MIGEERVCARENCEVVFRKKTHNQKYHDNDCCQLATNKRMMDKYYEKKAQKQGKPRYCSECNIVKLSRYNSSTICGACQNKEQTQIRISMAAMLSSVSVA